MNWLDHLINAGTMPFLVPIVAIIMGVAYAIVIAVLRHRERLAMIARGINPNQPPTRQ